jgi:YHS domain-containing protein
MPAMLEDPVCGMPVDEGDTKYSYEYKGKRYYFCTSECMDLFLRNPDKFIAGVRMKMGEGPSCRRWTNRSSNEPER